MGSSVSDSERRSEIAERTRSGLEEDLEDLREALRADLQEFERLVRRCVQSPPEWTGLKPPQLRAPFEFRRAELEEEAWIGPRLVAILAGRVEQFVGEWLPADGEPGVEPERIEELEEEARELVEQLVEIESKLVAAAEDGHVILDELWETTLARLDRFREGEIDALEDLVGEGALETGPDARQERASLWDEQRRKAERLRERWNALHDLIDDGTDYAIDGIEDLRAMMRRACEGLEGAYPAVAQREIVDEVFAQIGGEEVSKEPAPKDEERPVEGGEEEPEASKETVVEEASEETPEVAEEQPDEFEPEASLEDDTDETSSGSSDTVDQWLRKDADDPAPTEPMITSAGQARTGGERSDSSEMLAPEEAPGRQKREAEKADDHGAADTAFAVEDEEDEKPSKAEADAEDREVDEETGRASDTIPSDMASVMSEPAAAEKSPEVEQFDASADEAELPEPMEVGCIRIRTKWDTVDLWSQLAALGPPVGFLVGFVGLSLLHLTGLGGLVNPVAAWSWTESAVAVAFVWCVCAPMLLRWYPRWDGWRFQFVHEVEVRDEATLSLESEGFHLDRIAFKWEAIQHFRIRRWEADDDEMVGWLLVVEPAYYDALELIAPEYDRRRWEEAEGAILEPPTDAWQIESEALDRMTAFLEATNSELL